MKINARLGDASLTTDAAGHETIGVVVEIPPHAQRLLMNGADMLVAIPLGPAGLGGPSLMMRGRITIKDALGGAIAPAPAGTTQALPPDPKP